MRCQNKGCEALAEFTCFCNYPSLCEQHISDHQGNNHTIERLNIVLSKGECELLRRQATEKIICLKKTQNVFTELKEMLKSMTDRILLKDISKIQEQIDFFKAVQNFDRQSTTLRTKIDLNSAVTLATLRGISDQLRVFNNNIEEMLMEKDIQPIANPQIENQETLEGLKNRMDNFEIDYFVNDFGEGKNFRDRIREIKFSKENKYSFICKSNAGIFK